MPRLATAALVLVLAAAPTSAADKTDDVKIQDLELAVPQTWERTKPSSRLRLAQFAIPTAKGDEEQTELVVYSFPGGGGGVDPNLRRWLGEFSQGKAVKLTKGKAEQGEYVIADIAGKHLGTSFRRRPEPLADGRLLGAIITIEGKGIYFLKMVGQDATVESASKAFRAAFGADREKEKEYEVGG